MTKQATEGERISAIDITDGGVISRIYTYKEYLQIDKKK